MLPFPHLKTNPQKVHPYQQYYIFSEGFVCPIYPVSGERFLIAANSMWLKLFFFLGFTQICHYGLLHFQFSIMFIISYKLLLLSIITTIIVIINNFMLSLLLLPHTFVALLFLLFVYSIIHLIITIISLTMNICLLINFYIFVHNFAMTCCCCCCSCSCSCSCCCFYYH